MGDGIFLHTTSESWRQTYGIAIRTLAIAMDDPKDLNAETVLLLVRRWYGNTRSRKIKDIAAWRGFIPLSHMLLLNEKHCPNGIRHITFGFRCADISAVVFIEMFSKNEGNNAYGDPLYALIRYGEHEDLYPYDDDGSEDPLIFGVGCLANATFEVSKDSSMIWYPIIRVNPDIGNNLKLRNFLHNVMG